MSVIGNTALRLEDEPAMLLEVARDFCAAQGIEAARERLETPLSHTPEQWQSIVEMGWTGIGIDEAHGGAGLSIAAAVPVFESMGRALMGAPLMSSLLAAQLLQRVAGEASADTLAAIAGGAIATVAELENEDWQGRAALTLDAQGRLQGRKRMVMDAQSAACFLVTLKGDAGLRLALVDATTLAEDAITARVLMDNTRRAADVRFDGAEPVAVFEGEAVAAALRDYHLLGALLVAAESTGAAASCLDTMVAYLKTRKQFGKLIGSYQALKHPSVDILTAIDSARSFVYHGATLVGDTREGGEGGEGLTRDAEIACRMAKAQATETLAWAGDRAVQFHGGMGFTWDCDAQLFLRRAQWAQQQFGDAVYHRRRLAELLLDA
ncbi:MAG: acyl-CoA dehydrogenase family protein [Halieaceae bacterium]|jgi:alkylation response protein AidB-like acyl-CoA dehydrogenase|nr:acyl-CoA dehydrogenase family protein [Halieaceae bacterium]